MALNRREEAELALFEYVLGLNGLGLGGKAARIFDRYRAREIVPLSRKVRMLQNRVAVTDTAPTEAELDAIEEQWADIYERCLQDMRVLWLTEGAPAFAETAS